jgi:CheY-like chemotaxis protein
VAYKLLLADDSITIQKVVELILSEENFEIKSTGNGEEALAQIPSFKPDIVLADIEMPKMNGYQLCEKIKQDPSTSNIPVILLTGAFEPIDEELARQVKADDFIVKPFESQDLLSKVNSVLGVATAVAEQGEFVKAEAVGLEEVSDEEDLWAMEEIPEAAEAEALPEEEAAGAGTEEIFAVAEEAEAEQFAEEITPPVSEEAEAGKVKPAVREISLPPEDELVKVFEKAVGDKLSSFLSSLDLKEAVLASLMPLLKDSVEKILWEVAPDLVERMLKEMLQGSLESLGKEVEKVIWETVPDLAETMISKEIERIRSEF